MAPVGHWYPWYHQPAVPQYCFRSFRSLPFPFGMFPQAPHTPDLWVGGLERAAPTAADPREKLLSESVGGCSGNVLKMAADCVHHVAWSRPAMGRSKQSVDCTMEAQASMWQCKSMSHAGTGVEWL